MNSDNDSNIDIEKWNCIFFFFLQSAYVAAVSN